MMGVMAVVGWLAGWLPGAGERRNTLLQISSSRGLFFSLLSQYSTSLV